LLEARPLTVIVTSLPGFCTTDVGVMRLIDGTVKVTVKETAFEKSFSAGSYTRTGNEPGFASRSAGTPARSSLGETKVVGSSCPLNSTCDWLVKCCPLTLSEIAALPARTPTGASALITGELAPPMVNVNALLRLPSCGPHGYGVYTSICALPGEAISEASTAASSCVGLMKVVGSAEPFQSTTEYGRKPRPSARSVKDSPRAATVSGEMACSVGVGIMLAVVVSSARHGPPTKLLPTITLPSAETS
jgi:hypothetical protein